MNWCLICILSCCRWFIPMNVVLGSISGSLIGFIVATIVRPPYPFFKFTIIQIGIGKMLLLLTIFDWSSSTFFENLCIIWTNFELHYCLKSFGSLQLEDPMNKNFFNLLNFYKNCTLPMLVLFFISVGSSCVNITEYREHWKCATCFNCGFM